MKTKITRIAAFVLVVVAFALLNVNGADPVEIGVPNVSHNVVKIDGLDVFYREAGDRSKPTILLLHGFPTSSQMFRNLIPQLADKYHVVAPDYPGFGYSSMPKVNEFDYSFDNLANVVEKFTERLQLTK